MDPAERQRRLDLLKSEAVILGLWISREQERKILMEARYYAGTSSDPNTDPSVMLRVEPISYDVGIRAEVC